MAVNCLSFSSFGELVDGTFVVDTIRDPLIWFLGFPILNCMHDASLGHRTEPVNNPPQTGALVMLSCSHASVPFNACRSASCILLVASID
jgi:hypothetical protein